MNQAPRITVVILTLLRLIRTKNTVVIKLCVHTYNVEKCVIDFPRSVVLLCILLFYPTLCKAVVYCFVMNLSGAQCFYLLLFTLHITNRFAQSAFKAVHGTTPLHQGKENSPNSKVKMWNLGGRSSGRVPALAQRDEPGAPRFLPLHLSRLIWLFFPSRFVPIANYQFYELQSSLRDAEG